MPKDALATPSASGDTYLQQSRNPLHNLVFLLPAIALYAIGSIVFASGVVPTAERTIGAFFGVFGVVGMHLPSLALITVLLVQHLICKDSWRLSIPALPLMLLESAAWVVPLLVLSRVLEFGGALALLGDDLDEEGVVLNGDTRGEVPRGELAAELSGGRVAAAVALRSVDDTGRYGCVRLDGSLVTSFDEKGEAGPALEQAQQSVPRWWDDVT